MQKANGFSLFELLLVILLVGIGTSFMAYAFIRWQIRQQIRFTAREFSHSLVFARGYALAHETPVCIEIFQNKLAVKTQNTVIWNGLPIPASLEVHWQGALKQPNLCLNEQGQVEYLGSYFIESSDQTLQLLISRTGQIHERVSKATSLFSLD